MARSLQLLCAVALALRPAAAVPAPLGAGADPACEKTVEDLKAALDADTAALSQADQTYKDTVEQLNKQTEAAQSAEQAASSAYAQQVLVRDAAKDNDYKARDDFNKASLHLADLTNLCTQPQPPADCKTQLDAAEAVVNAARDTQTQQDAALVSAEAQLNAAFAQEQAAIAAYQAAVAFKDDQINKQQGRLENAQNKVNAATAAWQAADQKCHGAI